MANCTTNYNYIYPEASSLLLSYTDKSFQNTIKIIFFYLADYKIALKHLIHLIYDFRIY